MDVHLLMAERRRVSQEFRAKLASLTLQRSRLTDAMTDEGRQHLHAAVDEEADLCRKLGEKLLELDDLILAMQSRPTDPEEEEKVLPQPAPLRVPGVLGTSRRLRSGSQSLGRPAQHLRLPLGLGSPGGNRKMFAESAVGCRTRCPGAGLFPPRPGASVRSPAGMSNRLGFLGSPRSA